MSTNIKRSHDYTENYGRLISNTKKLFCSKLEFENEQKFFRNDRLDNISGCVGIPNLPHQSTLLGDANGFKKKFNERMLLPQDYLISSSSITGKAADEIMGKPTGLGPQRNSYRSGKDFVKSRCEKKITCSGSTKEKSSANSGNGGHFDFFNDKDSNKENFKGRANIMNSDF